MYFTLTVKHTYALKTASLSREVCNMSHSNWLSEAQLKAWISSLPFSKFEQQGQMLFEMGKERNTPTQLSVKTKTPQIKICKPQCNSNLKLPQRPILAVSYNTLQPLQLTVKALSLCSRAVSRSLG